MKNLIIVLSFLITGLAIAQEQNNTYNEGLYKATYNYEDGSVSQTGFFLDGKRHGVWISYDRSGNPIMKATFENGEKSGKWLILDKNTSKLHEITYNKNEMVASNTLEATDYFASIIE